ncbi:MAG: large conductance mechanosensitive channel protein MscL [Eubacterium sp.]|jgi:large conductance mechanosensitive channel protein|nr:large conductance mechanosensitive channel protein MscL [Eubacterium sp.]
MKKFLEEFKEFALKGNVMDMAIGVIIGGAFTAIVTAFTDDFITPVISIFGGTEFGGKIPLPGPEGNAILWGDFVSAVVNFLIVALILFLMLKGMNKLMNLRKKEEEEEEKDPEPTKEEVLLTEIRDILKNK